jgi:hypothetical protein
MKNSQLDRLLRFAQRTGDRLIVTDSEGQQPVVILSLDEYEALLNARPSTPTRTDLGQAEARQPVVEEEETVDLAGIEAAVEAVNREYTDEPKVVPVSRKQQPSDPGEEQFYLEPV